MFLVLSPPGAGQSLLHIRVLEGEGAIHSGGSKSTRGIVVQVADETGRPVDGAVVSFRMPEEGPGATFANGMRTEIVTTAPDGKAGIHELICGRLSGPYQVRVTVVKGGVRAGTVVSQYISDAPSKGSRQASGLRRNSWIVITAIAAAGAAAGVAASMAGGSHSPSPASVAPAAVPPPQIGTPQISIGRP